MLIRALYLLSITALFTQTYAESQHDTTAKTTATTPHVIKQDNLDVIIYTSKGCRYCTLVKEIFAEHNIPFVEKNVDRNGVLLKELEDNTGKRTVPQIMINGKHVGSYLDIAWGNLDEIISKAKE